MGFVTTRFYTPRPARPRRSSGLLLATLLTFATLPAAVPATALDLRLVTDNDFLTHNDRSDDLYTFALELEVDTGRITWTLRESAFTDRQAGVRFDETYLTVGRLAPRQWLGGWSLWAEIGAAHVGEGLFGQEAQNALHQLIGDDEVNLEYIDDSDVFAHLAVEVGRQFDVGTKLSLGPHATVRTTPGFKSDAWLAVRGRWSTWGDRLGFDVAIGPRLSHNELDVLEPHMKDSAVAASVEVALSNGLLVEWTVNRYGTGSEHLSFGYRFGVGRSPRRDGPWRERAAG